MVADPLPQTAIEQLATIHGAAETVVRRAGLAHPVAVEPIATTATEVLEVALAAYEPDDALAVRGAPHLESVRRRSPDAFDGPCLAMLGIAGGVLTVVRSTYFATIATCDALNAELAGWTGRAWRELLPMRARAVDLASGDVLHDGAGRAGAVGVSVVVTVPSAAGRSFVVGRRSASLAADPGRWHVAPSGMLEPDADDPIAATVATELREELGAAWNGPSGDLAVLGFAHDLRRLRPELCLRLDLPEWDGPPAASKEFERFDLVPVEPDAIARFWHEHPPNELTAAAAGAVALLERAG